MSSVEIGSYIANGITQGCIYALLGSGLALIWGTMKMMNFAQGEFYMLGGFGAYVGLRAFHINAVLAVALGIAVAIVVGILFELTILSLLLRRTEWEFPTIVATLGLSIFLQNLALHTYGADFHTIGEYWNGSAHILGVTITHQRILVVAVTILAFVCLAWVMRYTRVGIGIRALSQDREAAFLSGVRSRTIYLLTIILSVGLAGLGGALLAPIFSVNPYMGQSPLLKAFVVVIVGGLGSVEGAALAGLALGIIESFGIAVFSAQWEDVIAFVLLICFMYVRPRGLFGKVQT